MRTGGVVRPGKWRLPHGPPANMAPQQHHGRSNPPEYRSLPCLREHHRSRTHPPEQHVSPELRDDVEEGEEPVADHPHRAGQPQGQARRQPLRHGPQVQGVVVGVDQGEPGKEHQEGAHHHVEQPLPAAGRRAGGARARGREAVSRCSHEVQPATPLPAASTAGLSPSPLAGGDTAACVLCMGRPKPPHVWCMTPPTHPPPISILHAECCTVPTSAHCRTAAPPQSHAVPHCGVATGRPSERAHGLTAAHCHARRHALLVPTRVPCPTHPPTHLSRCVCHAPPTHPPTHLNRCVPHE